MNKAGLILAAFALGLCGISDGEWNTYHGDTALTGVANVTLPDKLAVLWRFKTGAPVRQTPIVHDRRIYFATARGEVIATDLKAERVWSRELFTGEKQKGAPVRESIEAPVAYLGDLLIVGASRGVVYALDPATGAEKWHTNIDSPILGTANYLQLNGSGRLYVIGQGDGMLHCLDAKTGNALWKSEEIGRCDGSPSVSSAAIVFGSCAAALHVIAPDTGKLLRNIPIDEDSQVAGGVALDGALAVSGSRSGKILEADVNAGKILWINKDCESEVFSTPAITPEVVVASANDGNVVALERASGKLRWRFDTKGSPSSPVIAGDKVVVTADGEVFLLKLADGAKLWSLKISDDVTSPAVIKGMVLVGGEDGSVVALGPEQAQERPANP